MNIKLKPEKITYFKVFFSLLVFSLSFWFIFKFIQPHLIYHASQPIFLTTAAFFREFSIVPGRLIFYFGNFIAQALYFDLTGTIVLLFVCCGIFLIGHSVLKMFLHKHLAYFLMYIPFICLITLLCNYSFPFVLIIDVLFLLITIRIGLTLLHTKLPLYIIYPLLSLPLYYISGSSSFMVFSLSYIFIILLKYRTLKNLWFIPCIVASMALLPYLVFNLFNLTLKEVYFHFNPAQLGFIINEQFFCFYLLYFFLPICLFILTLTTWLNKLFSTPGKQSSKDKKKLKSTVISEDSHTKNRKTWIFQCCGSLLILIAGIICIHAAQNQQSKILVEADYYCETENWDKVIEVALSSKEYNLHLNYSYNRAIRNNGQFLDMFFRFPQKMGVVSLFPDIINSSTTSKDCGDINFDLGNICQAHHWAHETQSSSLYNPKMLKRLVLTNLILGNYKASDKLLTLLSKEFHNNRFIETYRPYTTDTSLFITNSYLNEKRKSMPEAKIFTGGITDRLKALVKANGYNKLAYEHLQLFYLLDNELDSFAFYLPYAKVFYQKPPLIFEEALILYYQMHGYGISEVEQFGISQGSREQFQKFNEIISGCNGDKIAAQPLLAKDFSSTYYYYLLYLMPDLTDETIEKLKNNQY